MNVEEIAQVVHEANRALQAIQGDPAPSPPWEIAPEWQRASAISGVEGALGGLTPQESHASWMDYRREQGWIYGPVKDPEAKEHPCLVPYDELPEDQKVKDRVFVAIVQACSAQG